jgi:zinc/manganese transport system substrate-binding protein
VATGAELEVGWLPLVLRESGNAKIQPGQDGYFEAATQVALLEVPTRLDRADGDVHPGGNPHIQTDPRNIELVGAALTARMVELSPSDAAVFNARWEAFSKRWVEALSVWNAKAAPLRGVSVAVHHKAFPYLEDWLGLKEVAALEPKPGVEPSVAYLSQLLQKLSTNPPRLTLRAPFQSSKASEWLRREAGVPVVVVPFTVGGDEQSKDLFSLFDRTLDLLLAGLR